MTEKEFSKNKRFYTKERNIILKPYKEFHFHPSTENSLFVRIMKKKVRNGILPSFFIDVYDEIKRRARLVKKSPVRILREREEKEQREKWKALTPLEKRRITIQRKKNFERIEKYRTAFKV